MLLALGLIALGLTLLVCGGELLLRGAVGLATRLRLTPAVIGLTVVAAGTSIPELAVSASAAIHGNVDVAVGNVVGSNIFNIAFILGLTALVQPLVIGGNTTKLEYPVLLLATLACVAACGRGVVGRMDGVFFLAFYFGFTAYLVGLVREQLSETEVTEFRGEVKELVEAVDGRPRLPACLGRLAAGTTLLGFGAHVAVIGAVRLAELIGWSERVVGLTVVAVGTGLPEVVTSLVSAFRGRSDVALGNVIGSNLFNILVILGLSAVISPVPVAAGIRDGDNWWMLGVTALLLPILHTAGRITRWEGGLLLGVYLVYLTILLTVG